LAKVTTTRLGRGVVAAPALYLLLFTNVVEVEFSEVAPALVTLHT
jgi:hypothetical protein